MRFNRMRKVKSVQMRDRLEPRKLFCSTTRGADVLSIMQIKVRVVELLTSLKF